MRVGGTIHVQANGETMDAKGEFTCNDGSAERTSVIGEDRVHGFTEKPRPGSLKGKITDRGTLDLAALEAIAGEGSITCELANGKIFQLRNAFYVGSGDLSTGEGEFDFAFEGDGEYVS